MTTTKIELHDVLMRLREDLTNNLKQMGEAKMLDITGTGYTNHQADDATAYAGPPYSHTQAQAEDHSGYGRDLATL